MVKINHLCISMEITEKALSEISDSDLVELYISSQDIAYFDELYKRYSNKIYYKSFSMLKDLTLAEDATQEIFIKVLLNLSKFVGKSRFSTWVYSITYNHCIDLIRVTRKERGLFENEVSEDLDLVDDEEDSITNDELSIHALKETLDIIDEADRALLIMKYQDNLMIKDIAVILEITESAVKMRLKRAKEKFEKIYKEILRE